MRSSFLNIEHSFFLLLLLMVVSTSSCSLTKSLNDEDLVYTGTNIEISDKENAKTVKFLSRDLKLIPPTGTKTGIGNIYTGFYNLFDKTGEKGFKHWVKYKLGSEPVIFEERMIKSTQSKLSYYFNGKGFFGHEVKCDSIRKDRKVQIGCEVELGTRYTIDSVYFPIDSAYVDLTLVKTMQKLFLKQAKYYDREKLDFERLRISTHAGDVGFADFGVNNVYYYVDTAKGNSTVDIYTEILKPTDSTTHLRYTLDSIKIFPNYSLNTVGDQKLNKVEVNKRTHIFETDHYLDHKLINRLITQRPGYYYSRGNEKRSLNRLLDLGLFKFINVTNKPSKNGKKDHITQYLYLTPEQMQNISGEVELNNRSGNFLGTGISVRYQHRNFLGHAERLSVTLSGQVETQFGDGVSFINSSDLNATTELAFPRFIIPFFNIRENINFVPRTLVRSSFTYQRRTQFYTLQSLSLKYGWKWRQNKSKLHELYPLTINSVSVRDKSAEFQELLESDARLDRSFNNNLIAGIQYYYTFSNQYNRDDRRYTFMRFEMETSGNLVSLFNRRDKENPGQIAGINYSQFTKLTLDYRRYFPLGSADLATRVLLGTGFSYGNSKEMPFIKQYLIGGSNSLRAFRLRGLGPGGFIADPENINDFTSQFIDQTGDMKIELNVEYRFPVFQYLKGALFVDAGNIWLINNQERPEGNFSFDKFYQQIALGTGFGLRLDFNFFLIRMDIAFPLRAPMVNEGFTWQVSDINPFSSSWRSSNLRYNLGIGYPF